MLDNIGGIPGLRIERAAGLVTWQRSVPLTRPMNVVFHGHARPFGYEYYGIHRGTEDRLTFIASESKPIRSAFIDCRADSPAWGRRAELLLSPDLHASLVIPPGVAHTFDDLENVFTLNSFRNFLPHPDDWISGKVEWGLSEDTINLSRDVRDAELPRIECNQLEASDFFYELTSRNIAAQRSDAVRQYPLTKRVVFDDNTSALLKFRKVASPAMDVPEFSDIHGVAHAWWSRRAFVTGSDDADTGFTTFLGSGSLELIQLGQAEQTLLTAQFGSGAKLVTIFGPPQQSVLLRLCDGCNTVELAARPSPFRELVINPGLECSVSTTGPVLVAVQHGDSISEFLSLPSRREVPPAV